VTKGLVFVEGTPFDDSVHTKKLLERIGPIRETHYGGFYDFVPDMAKADTAYTNIALAAHTDTTYFTDPAGLQAFHLLSHTPAPGEPDATGGESLLVDGFHAAQLLKDSDPGLFWELAGRGLPWHASGNEGITITPDRLLPVFEMGSNDTVLKVRWNADDRGGKWPSLDREETAGPTAGTGRSEGTRRS
jgi:trimethyllysine dioxygenase